MQIGRWEDILVLLQIHTNFTKNAPTGVLPTILKTDVTQMGTVLSSQKKCYALCIKCIKM
uniref:Uncharacterized protein n=1 Tax=Anguilla anguilla TaxID=7936 RepID=A0A0E9WZA6_ANGAN